jgi:hypothetical protein
LKYSTPLFNNLENEGKLMAAMGIGKLGAPRVIFKRKFRWTLEINTPCGQVPAWFCKTAARPNLDIDEVELHFLNGVTWIPGKGKWQPITVTYLDVANLDLSGLLSWIATVYDFTDPVNLKMSEKASWAGNALLTMYDGCGTPLEFWLLQDCFPQAVNWGDLDMSASDICELELTLRYSSVAYKSACNNVRITPCCTGCTTQTDDTTTNGLL